MFSLEALFLGKNEEKENYMIKRKGNKRRRKKKKKEKEKKEKKNSLSFVSGSLMDYESGGCLFEKYLHNTYLCPISRK
jgi:hypothetical protein